MKSRTEMGLSYTQTFDIHNRLATVTVGGQTTEFLYDPDGNLVTKINPDGSKTIYVGGIYEEDKTSGGTVTGTKTYYPAAGAMRVTPPINGKDLFYVLKDHLGSASVLTDASGVPVTDADVRYLPFGEARPSNPNVGTAPMLTDKLFTGQRLIADLGIYHYGARFYSAKLGRFLSADTIIPSFANPQSLNRYSYVLNNPIRFTDPSGHICVPREECEGYTSTGRISVGYWKTKVNRQFGITMSGNWDGQNAVGIYDALSTMDSIIPGGIERFTQGSIYSFSHDPDHYGGRTNTSNGNISFWTYRRIPYQNIYHEVAHSIDIRSGGYFTQALTSNRVYTASGDFVMGGPAINYARNSLGYAQTYLIDPIGRSVEAEQHTATMNCSGRPDWCASGNNVDEEFADLVANYVAGNFVVDPTDPYYQYGIARQNWVTNIFTGYYLGPVHPLP